MYGGFLIWGSILTLSGGGVCEVTYEQSNPWGHEYSGEGGCLIMVFVNLIYHHRRSRCAWCTNNECITRRENIPWRKSFLFSFMLNSYIKLQGQWCYFSTSNLQVWVLGSTFREKNASCPGAACDLLAVLVTVKIRKGNLLTGPQKQIVQNKSFDKKLHPQFINQHHKMFKFNF